MMMPRGLAPWPSWSAPEVMLLLVGRITVARCQVETLMIAAAAQRNTGELTFSGDTYMVGPNAIA